MDVLLTNLQQLRDDVMSIWTRMSEEEFPVPCWIYAIKVKEVWLGTIKVYLIKWLVSVCALLLSWTLTEAPSKMSTLTRSDRAGDFPRSTGPVVFVSPSALVCVFCFLSVCGDLWPRLPDESRQVRVGGLRWHGRWQRVQRCLEAPRQSGKNYTLRQASLAKSCVPLQFFKFPSFIDNKCFSECAVRYAMYGDASGSAWIPGP